MPFPMKIQPVDFTSPEEESESTRNEPAKVFKSRFKRLFERQFCNGLKSLPEKTPAGGGGGGEKDTCDEFEPSSVCLNKMVENFIYDSSSSDKHQKCGRNCKCWKGNHGGFSDSSDDEADSVSCFGESFSNQSSITDAAESLKTLVVCACVRERNLLADAAKLVEKNKIGKYKVDFCRKAVTDGLVALGYDASVCKSRWEKSSSVPAGEYEYVDVEFGDERMIIDIDFRSEFEIARSTKAYKSLLQVLPTIFVGKADRLQKIVCIVSEAAKQSLKKKGMPFPPWRKADYVKAKWLSLYTRTTTPAPSLASSGNENAPAPAFSSNAPVVSRNEKAENGEKCLQVMEWKVPEMAKPKCSVPTGVKIITGLSSAIEGGNKKF